MTDLSWLNARESALLFGSEGQHAPVALQRLKCARLLWVNRQVALSDPAYAALGGDMGSYEKKLLDICAYAVPVPGDKFDAADQIVAYADRYGGGGIGQNGGSGRAAVVGSYSVKGVGRTTLISVRTDAEHASGGAYLEEAVRETIYAEVVRAEYPHSAVPILAIIDTGVEHDFGFKIERRVLIVRPCFMRPAHYVRAATYMSGNPTEGALDRARVEHAFHQTVALIGKQDFCNRYNTLWLNWATQLAYGFIHRLTHGSYTESNICFDGKMVDFGATSTVPSWADIATMTFRQSFDRLQRMPADVLRTNAYFFGRYLDPALANQATLNRLSAHIGYTFRTTIVVEMLRLAGLDRDRATRAALDNQWWPLANKLIARYQLEKLEMVDNVPTSYLPWDFGKIWEADVPLHLKPLRDAIERVLPQNKRALAARRCAWLTTSRPVLFRESVRHDIYRKIDPSQTRQEPQRSAIENLILEHVVEHRRDSRVAPADAVCVGFAVNSAMSYALFLAEDAAATGPLFAIDEHKPGTRFAIDRLTRTSIHFRNAENAPFHGALMVDGNLKHNYM